MCCDVFNVESVLSDSYLYREVVPAIDPFVVHELVKDTIEEKNEDAIQDVAVVPSLVMSKGQQKRARKKRQKLAISQLQDLTSDNEDKDGDLLQDASNCSEFNCDKQL